MTQAYNIFWAKCVIIVLFGAALVQVCKSFVLIKGDILINGSVQKPQTDSQRSKRNAVTDRKKIWDFGIVPYEIDPKANFDENQISNVKAAMIQWENSTCIKFVERNENEHENFIRFTDYEDTCSCCSFVGKKGGAQDVVIGGCDKIGIVHELGHVIGFHHEHQRPDRDEFVEIKWERMEDESSAYNYAKLSPDEADTLNEPYDFESIMHYTQTAFSILGDLNFLIQNMGYARFHGRNWSLADISVISAKKDKDGIVPKIPERKTKKTLSAIDIKKTNKLYKCPDCGRTYLEEAAFEETAYTSPEYHNRSTNRTYRCEWRIIVMDRERIQLKINDLDIFESSDCKSDYLEVRDGYLHNAPLLGRFC
ncbi:dorsal-ventral patterning tolloid-like protein 1, partial [Sitodiplosis mosellana]|uniref:dorsal-ventral patterning tolloid-like protein 1 n=1 Tax=Sitodiplosis mosellana TaxID=263140 RepID=UPI00244456B2